MSLPGRFPCDKTLSCPEFQGHWRPSRQDEEFWATSVKNEFKPSGSKIRLNCRCFPNIKASDAIVIIPGFNEPILKYVDTVHELYDAGFSVFLYDHRGQGLSDREPDLPREWHHNAHLDSYQDLVDDCHAFVSSLIKPTHTKVHVIGHSMGGLLAVNAVATNPALFKGGQVVLTAPMLDSVWGSTPRFMVTKIAPTLIALNFRQKLAPLPGGTLSWWDPDKPIDVALTHDAGRLTWYHALRSLNPRLASRGPTCGWIREQLKGQDEAMYKHAENFPNPVLLFTAEHDSFVKAPAHATFAALAPDCRRVFVPGAYHELLFEAPIYREPTLKAVIQWCQGSNEYGHRVPPVAPPLVLIDEDGKQPNDGAVMTSEAATQAAGNGGLVKVALSASFLVGFFAVLLHPGSSFGRSLSSVFRRHP